MKIGGGSSKENDWSPIREGVIRGNLRRSSIATKDDAVRGGGGRAPRISRKSWEENRDWGGEEDPSCF